jgi:large subunit ribosomal protein L7/L12
MATDLNALVDEMGQLTVIEAAELAKMLEEKWGVSASRPEMVSLTPALSSEPVAEQTEFTVILTSGGDKRVNVIKEVRSLTSLGLKEAKALVDEAPKTLKESVTKEEAARIKAQIEDAGGTVEIR